MGMKFAIKGRQGDVGDTGATGESGLRYIDRGDPSEADFHEGLPPPMGLTLDGAWRELDLSSIIPANAKMVRVHGWHVGAGIGAGIYFRKKGNSNEVLKQGQVVQANLQEIRFTEEIVVGDDGIIEYKGDPTTWTIYRVTVAGCWVL